MTIERRALVIASHWDALEVKPEDRLDLLETRAAELRHLLLDPARGACKPAFGDGLLIDPPTVEEMTDALTEAFEEASDAGACLVLGFLGHGHASREGEFLFPVRSSPKAPGPETALDLPGRLGSLALDNGGVRELMVVLDACLSGEGLLTAAKDWFRPAMTAGRRVALLTSSDLQVSFGLQFSTALNTLVRQGDVRLDTLLTTSGIRGALAHRLTLQTPQSTSFDGGGSRPLDPYGTSWLAHNVAYDARFSVLAASDGGVLLEALQRFQPPAGLVRFARTVRRHRLVAVVGAMGTGKTTLATALCRAELLPEPEAEETPLVCAVVQLNDALWGSGTSVQLITDQLNTHLPGFSEARTRYLEEVPPAERVPLPSTVADIAGPLTLMEPRDPVRVVVDGLDQVYPANRRRLIEELTALGAAAPDWFGVVTTVREGVRLPGDWHCEPVPPPGELQVRGYLAARQVPADVQREIVAQVAGNWEMTRLLAQYGPLTQGGPVSFATALTAKLGPLRSAVPGGNAHWLDLVLTVVAASGPGVTLPRTLLARSVSELGGPGDEESLEHVLDVLPGLVVRRPHESGTEQLVGFHHASMVEYMAHRTDVVSAHLSLVDALESIAPMDQHTPEDPVHAYAEQAEPEHLWQAAQRRPELYERLLESLERRAAPEATVNRDRWASWALRLAEPGRPGPDSPVTLRARERTAYWTHKAGAYGHARQLYQELLEDQRRLFSDDDPRVLETRGRIAYAAGEEGNFAEAIELHRAVLADQVRVFGADDPRTLKTRHHIAYWTGRGGNMREVLRLHEDLLEDQLRVLSPTDEAVLESRHYIAYWHGMLGRYDVALALHDELLRDRIAVFGEDHEQVVFSRMNICKFLGESGRRQEALDAYLALLPDVRRLRGEDHPNTLTVRLNIARYTWELGDPARALELHEELIEDQRRVRGADHPSVLITRYNIAMLKADLGDLATALAELDALLRERIARYGNPLHPEVIRTRFGRARVTAWTGDEASAAAELRRVRDDWARVLGEEHPDTVAAQEELDRLTAG
ncbi:tetratricopeptide repeat protein [Streptomyces mexicanus]|uniref:tetratricopeptide repeat protein n=2 Tax=Streptomyces mexicanus TaxID=178566 RepID=UPI003696D5E3